MKTERFNAYRNMWILVLFDLPTETKKERKSAYKFREYLLKDGFQMFQFSIYLRHCMSRENAKVHINRVKKALPALGHIGILSITDKQFGRMHLFTNRKQKEVDTAGKQLDFLDALGF